MMLNTYEQKSRQKFAATIISVLVVAGAVSLADYIKSNKTPVASIQNTTNTPFVPTTANPTSTTSTSTSNTTAASGTYKDGTYSASSEYYVPHGRESIRVTLTLQNGTVTDASIQNSENDFDSARYQEDFASTYKSYVVGKKIDGLELNYVAGASDTTQGFNDALNQIASQAKA